MRTDTNGGICYGYVRLDIEGDLGPHDECIECGQELGNGRPYLALMEDNTFYGPLCWVCATSQ